MKVPLCDKCRNDTTQKRMNPIIDSNELRAARAEGLDEIEKMTRQMAKRADKPAQRQAMAELEATLQRIRGEWKEHGLVAA